MVYLVINLTLLYSFNGRVKDVAQAEAWKSMSSYFSELIDTYTKVDDFEFPTPDQNDALNSAASSLLALQQKNSIIGVKERSEPISPGSVICANLLNSTGIYFI